MIELIPSWTEIDQFSTQLTNGERSFVQRIEKLFLHDKNRHLQIFVQANINGDKPDIVVLERGTGIWIIEVKDWQLDHYKVHRGHWVVESNVKKPRIKSPFQQADRYKQNFFSLHSFQLAKLNIENSRFYGSIKVAVYFHVASTEEAQHYKQQESQYHNNLKFIETFGQDCTDAQLRNFFKQPTMPMPIEEYDYLLRYLLPSDASREKSSTRYNEQQERLIISAPRKQKIKGVAGSGKSLVLAARAVDALKRTNGKILVLTFNLTLVNYLHDRISDVRGKYRRQDFDIISYHAFINAECNNHGIVFAFSDDPETAATSHYEDLSLFDEVKHEIQKYDAVFIDEVQDFKYEWQKMIERFFLKKGGELVLFGDEKQNVYGRELDDKAMKTVVPGNWNLLQQSYRLSSKATELAEAYQHYFFKDRYRLDSIQTTLDFEQKEQLQYIFTNDIGSIVPYLLQFIETNGLKTDDIVFLGNRKQTMRKIDRYLQQLGYYTLPMFIDADTYDMICHKYQDNRQLIKKKEQDLERPLKIGFWMQSGKIKISTIHSFKGWESSNIFLFMEAGTDHQEAIDELIYTGVTRCKKNLFIININSLRLHAFFEQNRHLFDYYNDVELPIFEY